MAKPRPLTAAECARLTGITVKALRVYERAGLITPARSPKGYRLYGQKELVRLNAIATLKSVGLTLAQIREAFETSAPRLPQVLRMQLDEWRARRAAADKAIRVVQGALVRVAARETLSIEELCQLIRSIEMTNVQEITRALLNEMLTPEEEREWSTYYARLPPEEMANNREHFETSRAITEELVKLMLAGANPASPEVQSLVVRSNQLSTRCRFREQYLARLAWNDALSRKLFALGHRVLLKSTMPPGTDLDEAEADFARFLFAAARASQAGQASDRLLGEVKALLARGGKIDSPAAQALASRFVEICSTHDLGDPHVYARWSIEFGRSRPEKPWTALAGENRQAWEFLAAAVPRH